MSDPREMTDADKARIEANLPHLNPPRIGLHEIAEVLRPFANYSAGARNMPDEFEITMGSRIARPQLTMGDCRRAAEVLKRIGEGL